MLRQPHVSQHSRVRKGDRLPNETAVFKPPDPISLLSFLDNLKTTCQINRLRGGAAISLFYVFHTKPRLDVLSYQMKADSKKNNLK